MKRIIVFAVLLLAAFSSSAQLVSRLSVGIGGGTSIIHSNVIVRYTLRPMGTFDLGYTFLGGVNDNVNLGFRSGLNVVFAQKQLQSVLSERFSQTDAYGDKYSYRISASSVSYVQNQVDLEVPLMLAIENKGFYVNVGAKFQMPVWNSFTQTINNPEIAAYDKKNDEYYVNDPATGILSNEEQSMSGTAILPVFFCALSMEIGHVWSVNDNHSLGFDLFIDYAPWSFYDNSQVNRNKRLVDIESVADELAKVTVNPLTECNKFEFRQFNAGVKFVYTFDIEHSVSKRHIQFR